MTALTLAIKKRKRIKPPKPPHYLLSTVIFVVLTCVGLYWDMFDILPTIAAIILNSVAAFIHLWGHEWKPLNRGKYTIPLVVIAVVTAYWTYYMVIFYNLYLKLWGDRK